jgi:hypothetical protein
MTAVPWMNEAFCCLFLKQNTCEAVQTGFRVICFAFLSNVVVVNVVVVVVVQKQTASHLVE